jgi:membrane protease subunit (stomatin/prohibitin family)
MKNPFGPQQDPGLYSYVNLQSRMLKSVQADRVNDQIFSAVQKAFEDALKQENVVLSSPEKKRMLAQIMKQVLADMLSKLGENSKS